MIKTEVHQWFRQKLDKTTSKFTSQSEIFCAFSVHQNLTWGPCNYHWILEFTPLSRGQFCVHASRRGFRFGLLATAVQWALSPPFQRRWWGEKHKGTPEHQQRSRTSGMDYSSEMLKQREQFFHWIFFFFFFLVPSKHAQDPHILDLPSPNDLIIPSLSSFSVIPQSIPCARCLLHLPLLLLLLWLPPLFRGDAAHVTRDSCIPGSTRSCWSPPGCGSVFSQLLRTTLLVSSSLWPGHLSLLWRLCPLSGR